MNLCDVFVIVLVTLLMIIQATLPSPILPPEMKVRGFSEISTGIVISAYSIAFIFGAFIPTDYLYNNLG